MGASIKLIAIKTADCVYISTSDGYNRSYYYSNDIKNLYFDGNLPEATRRDNWLRISKVPDNVQRKIPDAHINIRWELKEGFPESDLTPKIIDENPADEDSKYYDVSGLYTKKFDTQESGFELVEFEISVISEIDNFKIIKEDFPVAYGLLDQIRIDPAMLPYSPCQINTEDWYKIVREHVKTHIDGRYARVTSDYDFAFEVKKVITLCDPEPYKVDIGTKRKPNVTTKYRNTRECSVFSACPKPYQSYKLLPAIKGESYEDLERKVNKYLSDLIKTINEPVVECCNCKGSGVIFKSPQP